MILRNWDKKTHYIGKRKNWETQYIDSLCFRNTYHIYAHKNLPSRTTRTIIFQVITIEKCYAVYNVRSLKVQFNIPFAA